MSDELEDVIMGNLKHAMKAKQKFNYFLVGLTFSMLALAIKFQVQTDLIVPKIAEIIGCCLLLISGALGFYILRDEATFFISKADIQKNEMLKRQAEDRKKAGLLYKSPQEEDIHPDIVIQSYKDQIESDEAFLGGKEAESSTKSRAQRICFFIGVLSIFVSYLIPKLCEIFQKAPAVKAALISLQ